MTSSTASPPPAGEDGAAEPVAALLHRELRAAGSDARAAGASMEEVTADLTERLQRLRRHHNGG